VSGDSSFLRLATKCKGYALEFLLHFWKIVSLLEMDIMKGCIKGPSFLVLVNGMIMVGSMCVGPLTSYLVSLYLIIVSSVVQILVREVKLLTTW